jgi:hypothetical protein
MVLVSEANPADKRNDTMYTIDLASLSILLNGHVIHTEPGGRFAREGLRIAIEDLGLDRRAERALIHQVPLSEDEIRLHEQMGKRLLDTM